MEKPQILVVEDNADNMKLVSWILEDAGYEMTGVTTGEACLELMEHQEGETPEKEFDLILMDISLPGIDGKETTQRIRNIPSYADLPIIALTAHAIKGEGEAIRASGVTDLIIKPLQEDVLLKRLSAVLKN